jgi:hypothetical protein
LPPLTSIEFSNVCVDLLHIWLRISDKLETLLINKIILLDNAKDNDDLLDKPNLSKYINFLLYGCKINKPYFISNKKIEFRSLTGGEKLRLFSRIDLMRIFPKLENVAKIDALWKGFYNLYISVKDNAFPESSRVEQIKTSTKKWIDDFIRIHQSVNISPYMHTFGQHLWEMVSLHGDISRFTMQGLEKLNDLTTGHYFSSTNRNSNYLEQLLCKRNRTEAMNQENNDFDLFDLMLN